MSRQTRAEESRDKAVRVPVSSSRAPLVVKGFDHENYQGRFVNDVDDRIARFLEAGYEFVDKHGVAVGEPDVDSSTKALDSRVKKPVGRGVTAYLMRLPRELWNEDQKAKQRELDETDQAMKRPGSKGGLQEADYGSVSIGSQIGDEKPNFKTFGTRR